MRAALRQPFYLGAALFVALSSVWIAAGAGTLWDYPFDAGPPVDALAHLRLHAFLAARPDMGPLSIVLRAPFAALGQLLGSGGAANNYLSDYRFGLVPCVVAAGILGIALARMLEQDGRGVLARAAVVVLAVVNPVSVRAIHFGHPEEVLGAVLLTGSALAAVRRSAGLSIALLVMAILNKQWALVGAPAVVVILLQTTGFAKVRRPAIVMVGIALVVMGAVLAVDAHSLINQARHMIDLRGTYVFPASIWYPFAPHLGPGHFVQISRGLRAMPDWLGTIARPLILATGLALPLVLRGRIARDLRTRALPLLALVMLLRCALDPADNAYYHVPFFLALLAADAVTGRFYATAIAALLLQAPTTLNYTPTALNAYYIAWVVPFAAYLAARAAGVDAIGRLRTRAARDPAAARPAHR